MQRHRTGRPCPRKPDDTYPCCSQTRGRRADHHSGTTPGRRQRRAHRLDQGSIRPIRTARGRRALNPPPEATRRSGRQTDTTNDVHGRASLVLLRPPCEDQRHEGAARPFSYRFGAPGSSPTRKARRCVFPPYGRRPGPTWPRDRPRPPAGRAEGAGGKTRLDGNGGRHGWRDRAGFPDAGAGKPAYPLSTIGDLRGVPPDPGPHPGSRPEDALGPQRGGSRPRCPMPGEKPAGAGPPLGAGHGALNELHRRGGSARTGGDYAGGRRGESLGVHLGRARRHGGGNCCGGRISPAPPQLGGLRRGAAVRGPDGAYGRPEEPEAPGPTRSTGRGMSASSWTVV